MPLVNKVSQLWRIGGTHEVRNEQRIKRLSWRDGALRELAGERRLLPEREGWFERGACFEREVGERRFERERRAF